jgi:hypothetical protein
MLWVWIAVNNRRIAFVLRENYAKSDSRICGEAPDAHLAMAIPGSRRQGRRNPGKPPASNQKYARGHYHWEVEPSRCHFSKRDSSFLLVFSVLALTSLLGAVQGINQLAQDDQLAVPDAGFKIIENMSDAMILALAPRLLAPSPSHAVRSKSSPGRQEDSRLNHTYKFLSRVWVPR